MPNKRGVLINRESENFRNLINGGGVNINVGVGIREKALSDYTRTERTKAGFHEA